MDGCLTCEIRGTGKLRKFHDFFLLSRCCDGNCCCHCDKLRALWFVTMLELWANAARMEKLCDTVLHYSLFLYIDNNSGTQLERQSLPHTTRKLKNKIQVLWAPEWARQTRGIPTLHYLAQRKRSGNWKLVTIAAGKSVFWCSYKNGIMAVYYEYYSSASLFRLAVAVPINSEKIRLATRERWCRCEHGQVFMVHLER